MTRSTRFARLTRVERSEPLMPNVYSFRMPDDELENLNRLVRATGRVASDLMREALREYVKREL